MIKLFPKLDQFYIEGFNEFVSCHSQLFVKELCVLSRRYKSGYVTLREKEYIKILMDQIDLEKGDGFSLMVYDFKEWDDLINGIFKESE